jgi:hypothetical protein
MASVCTLVLLLGTPEGLLPNSPALDGSSSPAMRSAFLFRSRNHELSYTTNFTFPHTIASIVYISSCSNSID